MGSLVFFPTLTGFGRSSPTTCSSSSQKLQKPTWKPQKEAEPLESDVLFTPFAPLSKPTLLHSASCPPTKTTAATQMVGVI